MGKKVNSQGNYIPTIENETRNKEKIDIEKNNASSDILLEIARDEYSKGFERTNALDNKAGFFITVIIAISTIFIPIIPFERILSVYTGDCCFQKCLVSIMLFGIIIAFTLLIYADYKFYRAYRLAEFKHVNIDNVIEKKNHTTPKVQLNKALCDHYKKIVDHNNKVGNDKCESISIGIKYSGIGVLLLFVCTIVLIILIGG